MSQDSLTTLNRKHLWRMGQFSNHCLSCFSGTWSRLWSKSGSSQLRLVRTTDPSSGPVKMSIGWPFDVRRLKLHPQIIPALSLLEYESHEETGNSDIPPQSTNDFTFSLPPIPFFQTSNHPASLSVTIPSPSPLRRQIWDLLDEYIPALHFSIWLDVRQANEPGSITGFVPTHERPMSNFRRQSQGPWGLPEEEKGLLWSSVDWCVDQTECTLVFRGNKT